MTRPIATDQGGWHDRLDDATIACTWAGMVLGALAVLAGWPGYIACGVVVVVGALNMVARRGWLRGQATPPEEGDG